MGSFKQFPFAARTAVNDGSVAEQGCCESDVETHHSAGMTPHNALLEIFTMRLPGGVARRVLEARAPKHDGIVPPKPLLDKSSAHGSRDVAGVIRPTIPHGMVPFNWLWLMLRYERLPLRNSENHDDHHDGPCRRFHATFSTESDGGNDAPGRGDDSRLLETSRTVRNGNTDGEEADKEMEDAFGRTVRLLPASDRVSKYVSLLQICEDVVSLS